MGIKHILSVLYLGIYIKCGIENIFVFLHKIWVSLPNYNQNMQNIELTNGDYPWRVRIVR